MSKHYHTFCFWLSAAIVVVNALMLNVVTKVPLLRPTGIIFMLSGLSGLVGAFSHWRLWKKAN